MRAYHKPGSAMLSKHDFWYLDHIRNCWVMIWISFFIWPLLFRSHKELFRLVVPISNMEFSPAVWLEIVWQSMLFNTIKNTNGEKYNIVFTLAIGESVWLFLCAWQLFKVYLSWKFSIAFIKFLIKISKFGTQSVKRGNMHTL